MPIFILLAFYLISNRSVYAFDDDKTTTLRSIDRSAHNNVRRPVPLRDNADYEANESKYDDEVANYDNDEYDGYDDEDDGDEGEENDLHRVFSSLDTDASSSSDHISHKFILHAQNSSNGGNALTEAERSKESLVITNDPIEKCPKECSCLNDFMDCIRFNLNQIPHVPQFIGNL